MHDSCISMRSRRFLLISHKRKQNWCAYYNMVLFNASKQMGLIAICRRYLVQFCYNHQDGIRLFSSLLRYTFLSIRAQILGIESGMITEYSIARVKHLRNFLWMHLAAQLLMLSSAPVMETTRNPYSQLISGQVSSLFVQSHKRSLRLYPDFTS